MELLNELKRELQNYLLDSNNKEVLRDFNVAWDSIKQSYPHELQLILDVVDGYYECKGE